MNRVITINLNGNAYQLEEGGYDALRAYLDHAAHRLEGNPDKDEILADIEQAIADKFRAVLGANKTVVITKEVGEVVAAMGPVENSSTDDKGGSSSEKGKSDGAKSTTDTGEAETQSGPSVPRRLYRIYPEGAMLSGVCNGLAAYFNIDVTIVRLLFAILCFMWGTGILIYVLMALIVPVARTPEEKSAATGMAATAQEFIRRAKAGYYDGMKTMHDKHARREWRRKFKQEMRGWKYGFEQQMHQNGQHWQQNWTQHPKYWVGMGFTLEILKWVKFLFLALGIYAIYTLHKHGCVFGLAVPAGFPFWIGVILTIIAYKFLTWPIKVMKYGYYARAGMPGCCGAGPLSGLVWLGFLGVVVWCLDHYVPQFHEALKQLPPILHQGIDAIQKWLERA